FDQKTGMLSERHFQTSRRTPVAPVEPIESGDNVPEITRQYPRTFDSRPSSPVPEPTRSTGFHPVVERPQSGLHPMIERPKSGFHPSIDRPPIQRNFQPDANTQSSSNDVLRHILPMLRDEPM